MIQSFSLDGYRNLFPVSLSFPKEGVVFIGKNGQGKTNVLEAMYAFSIGKSFRSQNLYDAIAFEEQAFHLALQTEQMELEIHVANMPKKQVVYKINGEKKRFFDFLGKFQAVLFSPEDLEIIRGAPACRRDYIDSILIRIDKEYVLDLGHYEKTLKQRNVVLKNIESGSAESELDIWDELLEKYGKILWEKRKNLVQEFSKILEEKYSDIAQKHYKVRIEYLQKCSEAEFRSELLLRRKKDIIVGSTTAGPHRDDLVFYLQEHDASQFSSQGEVRTLVLALKYAEIEILERVHNAHVVLLLDDVFSELDTERQSSLLHMTKERQTFITTTHLDASLPTFGNIFEVEEGGVRRAESRVRSLESEEN